jgi:hypothetical protein
VTAITHMQRLDEDRRNQSSVLSSSARQTHS